MIASIEQQEELLYKSRIKDGYLPLNPFLSGVCRSQNVRINCPLCSIEPYYQY